MGRNKTLLCRYQMVLSFVSNHAYRDGARYSADAWGDFFNTWFVGSEKTPDGRRIGKKPDGFTNLEFKRFLRSIEDYASKEFGLALPLEEV
jgi:hypothetical protein